MPLSETQPEAGSRRIARPVPLRESVYSAILDMIVSRQLQPGQHLVESELALMLGVSRQPVREALQWLKNDGWVDLRPGLGAFVHTPTAEEADQLLAVRSLLETESARLAARNATEEGVARLRELCDRGHEALANEDVSALVELNAELLDAIAAGDADRAGEVMAAHTEHTRRSYLEHRDDEEEAGPAAALRGRLR